MIEEANEDPAGVLVVATLVAGGEVVPVAVAVVAAGAGGAAVVEATGALFAMNSQSSLTTLNVPNACSVVQPWRTHGVALEVSAALFSPHWHA